MVGGVRSMNGFLGVQLLGIGGSADDTSIGAKMIGGAQPRDPSTLAPPRILAPTNDAWKVICGTRRLGGDSTIKNLTQ